MSSARLTHLGASGEANMVDVADKAVSARVAVAQGHVVMQPSTLALVLEGNAKKGDVLATARIAGIMAAKKTSDLIPLCHQLNLSKVKITAEIKNDGIYLNSEVTTNAQTGVEMEALTAVSVAALTIYDMCKAVQKDIQITDIRLESKTGGKEDYHAD